MREKRKEEEGSRQAASEKGKVGYFSADTVMRNPFCPDTMVLALHYCLVTMSQDADFQRSSGREFKELIS